MAKKRKRLPPKDQTKWPGEGSPGHDVVDNTPEENKFDALYENALDEYSPSKPKPRPKPKPKPKPKTPKLKIPKVPSQEGHDTTIIDPSFGVGGKYKQDIVRKSASNKNYTNPSRNPKKN